MRIFPLRRSSLRYLVLIALAFTVLILMAQNILPVKDYTENFIDASKNTLRPLTMDSQTAFEGAFSSQSSSLRRSNDDKRLLVVPSMYDILPHLRNHPRALQPSLSFPNDSVREGVKLAIGVPTIPRQKVSYVLKTVRSLIFGMSPEEQINVVIILMIADSSDPRAVRNQILLINATFGEHINSGLLHVILPPNEWYPPDLNTTEPNLGDSPKRVLWRTKQNLDYMFLMLFSQPLAEYYLQMEDDAPAQPGYLTEIEKVIETKKDSRWFAIDFSTLGFIGKLFHAADLPHLVQFIAVLYRYRPVDWILDTLFWNRYCKPNDSRKKCLKEIKMRRLEEKTLFHHIGVQSSLNEGVQKVNKKSSGNNMSFSAHKENPPANVNTSLPHYKDFSFESLYKGYSPFWSSRSPNIGDYFQVRFSFPTAISVRTGNAEHPNDTLVESARLLWKLGNATLFDNGTAFDDTGIARISFKKPTVISHIRIEIHKEYQNWVIISELHVKL